MTFRTNVQFSAVSRGAVAVGGTLLLAFIAQTQLSSVHGSDQSANATAAAQLRAACEPAIRKSIARHSDTTDQKVINEAIDSLIAQQMALSRQDIEAVLKDPPGSWLPPDAEDLDPSGRSNCLFTGRLKQLQGGVPPAAAAARPAPPTGGTTAAPVAGRPSTEPARPGRIITETPPAGHNRENDATECVELIARNEFAAKRVRSIMGAVLRNTCPYDIGVIWCIVGGDCNPGYSNTWTIRANKDWPISAPTDRHFDAKWAACKDASGFQSGQAARSRAFKHACK